MDIWGDTRIDFVGKRKIAFLFSGVLSLLGLVAVIQVGLGNANLGIDFAGGTAIQLRFQQPVPIDQARSLLDRLGFPESELQQFREGNVLLIHIKGAPEFLGREAAEIQKGFAEAFPGNTFLVESQTEIGPVVGKRLKQDALWAVALALLGLLIYIALRFEFKFGVAATIATFHDILAVLGVFYLLDREINLLLITALLTLGGYSLTDTVVVFDRIRENLRTRVRRPLEETINRSINEVLRRTVVTSLTVLLVLIVLLFLGGEVIFDFSLALFLGVIVGTYSSIFVASPIFLVWRGGKGKLLGET
jgi:preprotein translocase subunit SecF